MRVPTGRSSAPTEAFWPSTRPGPAGVNVALEQLLYQRGHGRALLNGAREQSDADDMRLAVVDPTAPGAAEALALLGVTSVVTRGDALAYERGIPDGPPAELGDGFELAGSFRGCLSRVARHGLGCAGTGNASKCGLGAAPSVRRSGRDAEAPWGRRHHRAPRPRGQSGPAQLRRGPVLVATRELSSRGRLGIGAARGLGRCRQHPDRAATGSLAGSSRGVERRRDPDLRPESGRHGASAARPGGARLIRSRFLASSHDPGREPPDVRGVGRDECGRGQEGDRERSKAQPCEDRRARHRRRVDEQEHCSARP